MEDNLNENSSVNENPSAVNSTEVTTQETKTSMGMEENMESLLCYLFGWVTGLIFLFAEKNSKTVKFHAVQSLTLGIVVTVLYIVLDKFFLFVSWSLWAFISFLTGIIGIGYLILTIFLMVKTYKKEKLMLPVIGKFAEKTANK